MLLLLQMRFRCFKKTVGRKFHIVTNRDKSGNEVIKYFTTQTGKFSKSCGSYIPLVDDNSQLSHNCSKWRKGEGLWSHHNANRDQRRLINHVAYIYGIRHWNILGLSRWECDDNANKNFSPGDYWQIFVR